MWLRISLTAATPPTGRQVLVNGFDAWVETPDGRFQLAVQATPGQRVEVQASTNLINWATIAVVTLESSTAQVIDDAALNFNWRFYRSYTLP